MADLTLPSFQAKGFRAFRDLRIERLGRVNLIVGKNNVGKSSLLEALQIYAVRGYPSVIWEQISTRDEGVPPPLVAQGSDPAQLLHALQFLFNDRPDLFRRHKTELQLGPLGSDRDRLNIAVQQVPTREGLERRTGDDELAGVVAEEAPVLAVRLGRQHSVLYALDQSYGLRFGKRPFSPLTNAYVSPSGLSNVRLSEWWDGILLTDFERDVIDGLRLVAPGVEALAFLGDPLLPRERVPMVRISHASQPVPLRSLGDGMVRALGLVLALVNARDGILLIDEIENGLHYLMLPKLWRTIFDTARRLNVQVFATSHSWDCIQAFQQVAEEDTEAEGMLIRLEAKQGGIVATVFDEGELETATRERIEVR